MMKSSVKTFAPMGCWLLASWMGLGAVASAQSVWQGAAGGRQDWNTSAFWNPTNGIPNGVDAQALFNTNLTSALSLFWTGDLTLGKLSIGDTAATFFTTTIGDAGNRLIFDVSSGNAQLIMAPPTNTVREVVGADLVLNDTLEILVSNISSTGVILNGQISGSGGIIRKYLGDASPTNGASLVRITNQNNSYTGQTVIEHGMVEISGSVFKNQNSALGNASSAIVLGNANSPMSMTINNTGVGLTVKALSDTSDWVIERDLDFSKRAESANTENWRAALVFASDGAGGVNKNRLELSGDLIIGNKSAVINVDRDGMEIYITGDIRTWLPATGPNRSAQNLMFNTYGGSSNLDGIAAGTIRFSDRQRTYTNVQSLTNGTIIIEGNVGAEGTASPIGTKTVALSDGNGGNILSSEYGVRRFFMAVADTSYDRALVLGNGPNTVATGTGATYYGATNVNVYNGFVIGGQNTSGVVTFSGNISGNTVNVGSNKKVTLGHNLALTAETGGTVDFTGQILDSTSTDYNLRVTINQLRNHSQLDTNGDGVIDARANAAIGEASHGTVRLYAANNYEGGTEVMGGTLLARNTTGSATGTGMILVNTGTKFGGSGTVTPGANRLELKSGATLTPGDATANGGIGRLNVTGDVKLNATGGSILDFQVMALNGLNATASDNLTSGALNWSTILSGTVNANTSDYLQITGHLEANSSGVTLVNISLAGADDLEAGMAWNLWDATTTSTLTEDTFAFNFQGLDTQLMSRGLAFDTSHFANFGVLAVTVVPEPSRLMLVGAALASLVLRRRRRAK